MKKGVSHKTTMHTTWLKILLFLCVTIVFLLYHLLLFLNSKSSVYCGGSMGQRERTNERVDLCFMWFDCINLNYIDCDCY